jgi:molybdenum cofactor cytidylyltransferase
MGSPKALLEFGGETFLDRLILILGQSCSPVIVVLGYEPHRIKTGLSDAAMATFVTNPDYTRGQLSSLQCGLAAVPEPAEGVMFIPVDHPAVRPSTVASIARRFQERSPEELLVVPRFEGQRGHPVCVSSELIPEFLALPEGAQARDVVHGHLKQTAYLEVDDPGVLKDIDDPASYFLITGQKPRARL